MSDKWIAAAVVVCVLTMAIVWIAAMGGW